MFQIAVLTDLCNECGNCTTFCPTAGEPYRDKPRLYISRTEFEDQQDNAFMVFRQPETWAMEARWQGETHRLELNSRLVYHAPAFSAKLDTQTFKPMQINVNEGVEAGEVLSLEPAASMYVLLNGLKNSLPFLPTASPEGFIDKGKIPHPGYPD
jgi:putative selenate reductase